MTLRSGDEGDGPDEHRDYDPTSKGGPSDLVAGAAVVSELNERPGNDSGDRERYRPDSVTITR